VVTRASVPNRFGFGVRFDAIPGTSLAASAEWNEWTAMQPLGSQQLRARDSWDLGLGADFIGPRLSGQPVRWRVGVRTRSLPFDAANNRVRERSIAFGAGIPISGPRVGLDLALQRAARTGAPQISERAWILNMGFSVRP
jgi:hypothetical protein